MKNKNTYLAELEKFRAIFTNLGPFVNRSRASKETTISYLTGVNHSAKSAKGTEEHIYISILYLAPGNLCTVLNTCPMASPECLEACLNKSGRAKIEAFAGLNTIERARVLRTWLFHFNRPYFMAWLGAEIEAAQVKYNKPGNKYAARLNGTSDIKWENVKYQGFSNIFEAFPGVTFYDYTKWPARKIDQIKNYSLTFSYTGRNTLDALNILSKGGNIAIVFNVAKGRPLPGYWNNYKVINGDLTDYRPGDPAGVIVGLRFKLTASETVNQAAKNSPFIVDPMALNCQYIENVA